MNGEVKRVRVEMEDSRRRGQKLKRMVERRKTRNYWMLSNSAGWELTWLKEVALTGREIGKFRTQYTSA